MLLPGPRNDGCAAPNCERPHRARGYCNVHYERWRLLGDAEAPTRPASGGRGGAGGPGAWLPVVGYHGVHARLRKTKGLASTHPCQHCGNPAVAWAYTNDDPNELVDAEGRYSLDLDRYIPLCHACHTTFDRAYRAGLALDGGAA